MLTCSFLICIFVCCRYSGCFGGATGRGGKVTAADLQINKISMMAGEDTGPWKQIQNDSPKFAYFLIPNRSPKSLKPLLTQFIVSYCI